MLVLNNDSLNLSNSLNLFNFIKFQIKNDFENSSYLSENQRDFIFEKESSFKKIADFIQKDENFVNELFKRTNENLEDLINFLKGNSNILWTQEEDRVLLEEEVNSTAYKILLKFRGGVSIMKRVEYLKKN